MKLKEVAKVMSMKALIKVVSTVTKPFVKILKMRGGDYYDLVIKEIEDGMFWDDIFKAKNKIYEYEEMTKGIKIDDLRDSKTSIKILQKSIELVSCYESIEFDLYMAHSFFGGTKDFEVTREVYENLEKELDRAIYVKSVIKKILDKEI